MGSVFKVKLLDCLDDTNFNAANVVDQFIILYKPDGTSTIHQGTLIEESGAWFVRYINGNDNPIPEDSSVFNLVGWYEYVAKIILVNGDIIQNSRRAGIWVS